MALRAANPCEATLEPATTQKLLYRTNHNRPQRARARLETFFVTTDVAVEVVFKELLKHRSFGCLGRYCAGASAIRRPAGSSAGKGDWAKPQQARTTGWRM